MKIHWHKPLYMGARAGEKRFRIIQRLRLGRPMHGTHVITPAVGERNLLDIYPAGDMKKPCYRDREFFILGIGADYDDAVELAGRIISQVYRETGGFDVSVFLEKQNR